MPMIDLTVPAGALGAQARDALTDELAGLLLRSEGAPGGGMHGCRALEGTFLGGCLVSGRTAGRALARG